MSKDKAGAKMEVEEGGKRQTEASPSHTAA